MKEDVYIMYVLLSRYRGGRKEGIVMKIGKERKRRRKTPKSFFAFELRRKVFFFKYTFYVY